MKALKAAAAVRRRRVEDALSARCAAPSCQRHAPSM